MKTLFLFIFSILSVYNINAQNLSSHQLDSLYNSVINVTDYSSIKNGRIANPSAISNNNNGIDKCGFGLFSEVRTHLSSFKVDQQRVLAKILSRPTLDSSIVSPSGFFRIHYSLSGNNAPSYSVYDFALALDSAYNFEVNYLGFPPPPSDNGAGGDNKYDVYIENLGNLYGYTELESEVSSGSNTWITYMVVDNDFKGFYTTGINAARVTAAHEFHHSIQNGNYLYRESDIYFYELTSTSMESFVFPSIHDYFDYISDYLNYTSRAFALNNGYDLAIWNIFLRDNYGYDIIKHQWELMPKMRAINAINSSLANYNTSFGVELNKFGEWCYFTGSRAVSGKYFENAKYYPMVKYISTVPFQSPSKAVNLQVGPVSNTFLCFNNSQNLDTLVAIITNSDLRNGIDSVHSLSAFNYYLYDYNADGSTALLNTPYYSTFKPEKASGWFHGEIFNNIPVTTSEQIFTPIDYAYPSPFYYNKSDYIFFPVEPDNSNYADLVVYSSGMNVVYSANLQINTNSSGQKVIKWNVKNDNQKLPTGVYLFITKSGNNKKTGKLVIFHD